ncbi:RNA polymerase sigma factor, partial [Streptomyces sp.]|uniref:RNA polymerase sigma factor n=1 Tax=Streptomyces sp. TaxID=1931 RepID=UPI002D7A179D
SRWRRRSSSLDAWRRHAAGQADRTPSPEPGTVALVTALRQLSERQRRIAVLHYVCDLSVEQVAAETGISTGTVKTHLSRARAALAPHLSEAEFKEDHGV